MLRGRAVSLGEVRSSRSRLGCRQRQVPWPMPLRVALRQPLAGHPPCRWRPAARRHRAGHHRPGPRRPLLVLRCVGPRLATIRCASHGAAAPSRVLLPTAVPDIHVRLQHHPTLEAGDAHDPVFGQAGRCELTSSQVACPLAGRRRCDHRGIVLIRRSSSSTAAAGRTMSGRCRERLAWPTSCLAMSRRSACHWLRREEGIAGRSRCV